MLHVQVTDSTRQPVGNVELLVLRGGQPVEVRRSSEGAGGVRVAVPAGEYEVVARRLGFARAGRFVRVRAGDTVVVALTLTPVAQQLSEVRVTARETLDRRTYYLDADAIAASRRRMWNALDVVAALRPDMLTSRAGWRVCGTVQDVWINGRRVPRPFVPDPVVSSRPLPNVSPKAPVPSGVLTILSQVRPEHIAEMRYRDCFDRTGRAVGMSNALFIVLKPGVEYREDEGTVVVESAPESAVPPPAPN
jgi:hypothetical protein